MARFSYKTDVPMGAMVSEVGVTANDQAGFRSALNQLAELEKTPFDGILPNLNQG